MPKRWYVGYRGTTPVAFPTDEVRIRIYSQAPYNFTYVVGPFRTKRAAKWVEAHPWIEYGHVDVAEKRAKNWVPSAD